MSCSNYKGQLQTIEWNALNDKNDYTAPMSLLLPCIQTYLPNPYFCGRIYNALLFGEQNFFKLLPQNTKQDAL